MTDNFPNWAYDIYWDWDNKINIGLYIYLKDYFKIDFEDCFCIKSQLVANYLYKLGDLE